MDNLMTQAQLIRARSALDSALGFQTAPERQAKAFVEFALGQLRGLDGWQIGQASRNSELEFLRKDASAANLADVGLSLPELSALAASYVASIAEWSLLDQLVAYGRPLPGNGRRALVATGFVADVSVAEAHPKVVKTLDIAAEDVEPHKSAAILTMTKEFALSPQAAAVFERELMAAVLRASNRAVLDYLVSTDTATLPATGDPLEDLRIGLRAAGPSDAYVIAVPGGYCVDLATRMEAGGRLGVRGGQLVPGIHLVAVDDLDGVHVIPASRVAVRDYGLETRMARDASVNMADTPTAPSTLVSLFQTGSVGLIAERSFLVYADPAETVIVAGS